LINESFSDGVSHLMIEKLPRREWPSARLRFAVMRVHFTEIERPRRPAEANWRVRDMADSLTGAGLADSQSCPVTALTGQATHGMARIDRGPGTS
jgi:hypothetical protein